MNYRKKNPIRENIIINCKLVTVRLFQRHGGAVLIRVSRFVGDKDIDIVLCWHRRSWVFFYLSSLQIWAFFTIKLQNQISSLLKRNKENDVYLLNSTLQINIYLRNGDNVIAQSTQLLQFCIISNSVYSVLIVVMCIPTGAFLIV